MAGPTPCTQINLLASRGLAEELVRDLGIDIGYLVGAVGTGGTLCGTVSELRRLGSKVVSIGVEPAGSIIFGGPARQHWQTGAGASEGFCLNVDHSRSMRSLPFAISTPLQQRGLLRGKQDFWSAGQQEWPSMSP
ncbi:pyridoxal-phosphate dependent enzyme [Agrobacterium tumefaciens]|uniref:pyridoxal-phosphate dependent enzyme n=1 Tax=Agrobacterium tumefaciens TaxID=358 RepID=UPI0029347B49|nr:pyridoxal-phosphate dependent enzyme [Agrobacterium tumefaciens]